MRLDDEIQALSKRRSDSFTRGWVSTFPGFERNKAKDCFHYSLVCDFDSFYVAMLVATINVF